MAKDGEKKSTDSTHEIDGNDFISRVKAASQVGLKCPNCGCRDFRDEEGRPFKTYRTMNIPNAIRRYKICRNCGRRVRTKETIEKNE